jgi:hypothetical protein
MSPVMWVAQPRPHRESYEGQAGAGAHHRCRAAYRECVGPVAAEPQRDERSGEDERQERAEGDAPGSVVPVMDREPCQPGEDAGTYQGVGAVAVDA